MLQDLETFAIDSFKLKAKYLWTKEQQDYYFNNNYKEDEMPILDRMGTYIVKNTQNATALEY